MDFLDPKKQRQHMITLYVGYVLIAIAITLITLVLLYRAGGFGLDKNGDVIQNGYLFASSIPTGADIKLNGKDSQKHTNTRMQLISGNYVMQLKRQDYRTWQQVLDIQGGVISRYDYAFLVPTKLTTTSLPAYSGLPGMATQSPDRRWLVVQKPGSDTTFDEYDLKNPKTAAVSLRLPDGVATSGPNQTYELVEWANDNQHVVLKHTYDNGKYEYILLDRADPTKSENLSTVLNATPTKLNLINKKYDQYYLYDAQKQTLQSASLGTPAPTTVLEHVLTYKGYSSDMILYASSLPTATGKVTINLLQGGKTYAIRSVTAGSDYLLDLTKYDGSWYIAAGSVSEGRVYVFKNPVAQLGSRLGVVVPIYILHVNAPNYLAFSPNTRFIMIEGGSQFAVYDAEYDKGYSYDARAPLDAPQPHGSWMDGNHLSYISGGKLIMFDFDHGNPQTLMPADPAYPPAFSPDYKFVDALAPAAGSSSPVSLTSTSLRTPADQ